MIPYDTITAWSYDHTWPTRDQVEQEILLRRIQKELKERRSIKRLLFVTKNFIMLEINI